MPTADSTARRHPKRSRTVPAAIAERIDLDRRAARTAVLAGDVATAWALLEETHVLSQPWAWPHVRSHLDMLRLAVSTKDVRELRGQVLRAVVAGPGSAARRYPLGNTGRANVPATRPMPVPTELAALLATD